MRAIKSSLIEKLKRLSPSRVAQVEEFVDFLAAQEERAAVEQYLGNAMNKLDALNLRALSNDEIEQEVETVRQARREHREG